MPRSCHLAVALLVALAAAGGAPVLAQSDAGPQRRQLVAPGRLSAAEATALIGRSVSTRDGRDAGAIRDFTLTGPSGVVDHAIIASGGVLGLGTTLVLVPADRLRVGAATAVPQPGEGAPMEVTIDLSAAELSEAPTFADDGTVRTLTGGR
ncbi:PRC-barrel domain-containing protein [Azospirillum sp. A39]|uniref:PRC-barrel domain-containing protein n=1 Tax=Azospirillum sp. A39 TaxID=3462279 RepID=UPI0040452B73